MLRGVPKAAPYVIIPLLLAYVLLGLREINARGADQERAEALMEYSTYHPQVRDSLPFEGPYFVIREWDISNSVRTFDADERQFLSRLLPEMKFARHIASARTAVMVTSRFGYMDLRRDREPEDMICFIDLDDTSRRHVEWVFASPPLTLEPPSAPDLLAAPATLPELRDPRRLSTLLAINAALLAMHARETTDSVSPHVVAGAGRTDVLWGMLRQGAIVPDAPNGDGATLLHAAAFEGRKETVELLLRHGADVNAVDFGGMTPLHHAAWGGSVEMCRLLIDNGADASVADANSRTPIHVAARAGNVEALGMLIAEAPESVSVGDGDGTTPLHFAARTGGVGCVESLMAAGASPTAQDGHHDMPLHNAIRNRDFPVARALLQHSSPTDVALQVDPEGGYGGPLPIALIYVNTDIITLLLRYGAPVEDGLLLDLARHGNDYHESDLIEICRMLVAAGAGMGEDTSEVEKSAARAAEYGYVELAAMLRQYAPPEPSQAP